MSMLGLRGPKAAPKLNRPSLGTCEPNKVEVLLARAKRSRHSMRRQSLTFVTTLRCALPALFAYIDAPAEVCP
jgi:hypothetical protein